MTVSEAAPPSSVLAAFGVSAEPIPLGGGFAGAWRCGRLVLKRSDAPHAALESEARVLGSVASATLRIGRLERAVNGSIAVDGWIARGFLEGDHAPHRAREIIAVGDALNAALEGVARADAASMVEGRTDPWARADRIAWGEEPVPSVPEFDAYPLPQLVAARQPVRAPSQLVHGDLAGNVLFADGLPPAVIDFSPYWRPAVWAQSVAVGDCVMWLGAPLDLVDALAGRADLGQCLVRAIIFRHVTGVLLGRGKLSPEGSRRYRALVEAAIAMA
jgi:uncharacterized protein (TIGR02569 family)